MQIEQANQVLFVSTLDKQMAPTTPQAALKSEDNNEKISFAKFVHWYKSSLDLPQQHIKAQLNSIVMNGKMNKAKMATLTHNIVSGL